MMLYMYIDACNRWMIKQQDCMVSINETIKTGNVSITLQEADTTYNHNIAIYYFSALSSQTVED